MYTATLQIVGLHSFVHVFYKYMLSDCCTYWLFVTMTHPYGGLYINNCFLVAIDFCVQWSRCHWSWCGSNNVLCELGLQIISSFYYFLAKLHAEFAFYYCLLALLSRFSIQAEIPPKSSVQFFVQWKFASMLLLEAVWVLKVWKYRHYDYFVISRKTCPEYYIGGGSWMSNFVLKEFKAVGKWNKSL